MSNKAIYRTNVCIKPPCGWRELEWCDDLGEWYCPECMARYGDDARGYSFRVARSKWPNDEMSDKEWAHLVADAAIKAHGDRHYIAIAAWMEAFCAGIDWYMRAER